MLTNVVVAELALLSRASVHIRRFCYLRAGNATFNENKGLDHDHEFAGAIIISAIGLFILSAISWTASVARAGLEEDSRRRQVHAGVRDSGMARGESYMFPRAANKNRSRQRSICRKIQGRTGRIVT